MMVLPASGVECSGKIAMTALPIGPGQRVYCRNANRIDAFLLARVPREFANHESGNGTRRLRQGMQIARGIYLCKPRDA
jgi:hypothetical protein